MATVAEPQPAELPLPGGQPGARVRLTPLESGRAAVPPAYLNRTEGRMAKLRALGLGVPREQWVTVPVPCFLIEHPTAGLVLVDTGLHPSVAVEPAQNLGRLLSRWIGEVDFAPERSAAAQLRARGLDPAKVGTVVMTHLHFDHASAMAEFPNAVFVFDELEWEAATAPRSVLRGYVQGQFDHGFDYRTLDFDSEEVSSFASFGRSLDLFGDGSIRLLATPGHSRGHVSVALRLRGREALICGDAAYTQGTLDFSELPGIVDDEHLFRRSLREIQRYVELTPGSLVVPGHDLERWEAIAYGSEPSSSPASSEARRAR